MAGPTNCQESVIKDSRYQHTARLMGVSGPTSELEAEGVIQRAKDGFPLDQSRVAYLRYLRRERRNRHAVKRTLIFSGQIRTDPAPHSGEATTPDPRWKRPGHMDEVVGLFLSRLSRLSEVVIWPRVFLNPFCVSAPLFSRWP